MTPEEPWRRLSSAPPPSAPRCTPSTPPTPIGFQKFCLFRRGDLIGSVSLRTSLEAACARQAGFSSWGGSDGTSGRSSGPRLPSGAASASLHSHFQVQVRRGGRAFLPGKSTGTVHWGAGLVCLTLREGFSNRSGVGGAGSPAHSRSAASRSSPRLLTPPFPQHDTQGAKKSGGGFHGESPISNHGGGVRDR